MKKLLPVSSAAAALCVPLTLLAQDAPPSPATQSITITGQRDSHAPPPTATPTKTDTPLLLVPQSVQVVPRAVLNEQKALTLSDAVRNVAGSGQDFGFNGSTQPLLMLRGFQTVSMTAPGSMSGSAGYHLNGVKVQGVPLNMANAHSVEVIKGPATVLYGRAEPGGMINVVPRALPLANEFGFEQTLGQYGLTRTLVEGGGALNAERTLLGRASVSYNATDSARDFVTDRVGAGSGTLGWRPDADTEVKLTLDRIDQRYRNDYGIPAIGNRPGDFPIERQYNDAPELSRIRTTSELLEWSQRLSTSWQMKARAVSVRGRMREVDVTPYRIDLSSSADCLATANELCRYYYFVRPDGRYRLDQATVDLIGNIDFAGLRHTLLVGADAYRSRKSGTTYFQQLASVNVDNPQLGNTPPLDTDTATASDLEDRNRWISVYAQDQVAFGNGWHGVLALRHDRTRAAFGDPATTAPNDVSFITPRIGVVWEFAPGQTVYAQGQRALSANNGRDATTQRALDPEISTQFEAGYKRIALDGKLHTTVAGYQLTKRNRADYSLFPIVQTVGEARSRGIEVDVLGQLMPRLATIASYAYTDAEVTRDLQFRGTRLANVARHSGSIWLRWMIDGQWAVGGGVFAQGQRQGDQGNTFQLPGYARVDAMVSYAFSAPGGAKGAKGSLQLNVNNLFDRRFFTGSHPLVQDWIKPGDPRTALVSLRVDY
jgi:iron complex outermembrane recepter protein